MRMLSEIIMKVKIAEKLISGQALHARSIEMLNEDDSCGKLWKFLKIMKNWIIGTSSPYNQNQVQDDNYKNYEQLWKNYYWVHTRSIKMTHAFDIYD